MRCSTLLNGGNGLGLGFGFALITAAGFIGKAERLQLAMQRRAFHADEHRRLGDVARKPPDLGAQIFTFKGFAGFAQRGAHYRAHRLAGDKPRRFGGDLGGQHVDVDAVDPIGGREDERAFDDIAQLTPGQS